MVRGHRGGDITTFVHFTIDKYFAGEQYDTDDYRLALRQLVIQDGTLQDVEIPCDQGGTESITCSRWPEGRLTLAENQSSGCGKFVLCKNRWTPLPGLSARDRLVYFDCSQCQGEESPLELGRGRETGQLLVRLDKASPVTDCVMQLAFVVEPDLACLEPVQEGEPVQLQTDLCPSAIRERLDRDVFSASARGYPACQELVRIRNTPDMALRLNRLANWCQSFSSDRDVPGQGLDLLVNLIRGKQGVCRHRSRVFQALSHYFGVMARMVKNTAHRYIEVNLDGGSRWRKINLGGGGSYTWEEIELPLWKRVDLSIVQKNSRGGLSVGDQFKQNVLTLLDKGFCQQQWQPLYQFLASKLPSVSQLEALGIIGFYAGHFREGGSRKDEAERRYNLFFNLDWPGIFTKWHDLISQISLAASATGATSGISATREGVTEKFHYVLFSIRELWKNRLVSDTTYFDRIKQFLPLIRGGIVPVDLLLPVLEDVIRSPYGGEAEGLLDSCYQRLMQPREWSDEIKEGASLQDREEFVLDLGGQSKTMLQALNRVSFQRQWSLIPAGERLDITRMVTGQPCYSRLEEEREARMVVICLPLTFSVEHEFAKDRELVGDEYNCFARSSFLFWLFQQDTQHTWRYLCLNMSLYREGSSSIEIPNGCYPSLHKYHCSTDHVSLCQATLKKYLVSTEDDISPAMERRIKKALGDPDALVITPEFFSMCYKEYLETMDIDLLKEYAGKRV